MRPTTCTRRFWLACATTLGASLALSAPASAQAQANWPEKNVRFVVAFAAGGAADVVARLVGQNLGERWGKTVIIENRGGGGGNIGAQAVSRSDPDGYTILVTTSAIAANLTYYDNPGYSAADLKTVALLATQPNIIVGAKDLKANNLKEVIALSKTENLSYGTAGPGTTPHLSAERIFRLVGKADIRHVPFTGAAPAVAATVSGHVPLASVALSGAIEQVKGGLVKGLAVTSLQRFPDLPDVPTVKESGLGDIDDATWVAAYAPAKTPAAIVTKINADMSAALKDQKVRDGLVRAGYLPLGGSLADADSFMQSEVKKWGDVVRASGVKAAN
jgi:tripartite-type tricarboxylate transporter receptor subunit TctC